MIGGLRRLRGWLRGRAPGAGPAPVRAGRAGPVAYRPGDPGLIEVPELEAGGLEEVAPGVFQGRLLPEEWTGRLLEEVERWEAALLRGEVREEPPNSMHRYGAPLERLGLAALGDRLLARGLAARMELSFPGTGPLTESHAFIVRYGAGGDDGLDLHVDDSDVTLSLCLGGRFSGSGLQFEGVRCGLHLDHPARPEEISTVAHRPGEGVLHLGKRRHRVLPITAGSRVGLILWARRSGSRERFEAEADAGRCLPECGV